MNPNSEKFQQISYLCRWQEVRQKIKEITPKNQGHYFVTN
jgi:hypothetical protein